MQPELLPTTSRVLTQVISHKKEFGDLFDGFTKLHAITYVASPELILEFFDKGHYEEIEVVVGENLAKAWREELQQKTIETTERLAELVEKSKLRIFIPDRTVHTKLYVLTRADGLHRVIQTSANLTETAQQASKQINYAWYVDIPADDPFLKQVLLDYKDHLDGCSLFMGDLTELFSKRPDLTRRELIEVWRSDVATVADGLEIRETFQQISLNALEHAQHGEKPIFTIALPKEPATKKQVERLLAPSNAVITPEHAQVNGLAFIRFVQESQGFPLMRISLERREVLLGLNGAVHTLTEPPLAPKTVNEALKHLEDYIQTVELGESTNRKVAKASMFEALLYMLFSPFANEFMKVKRATRGEINLRGPRLLYIYGPTYNGKTTFLRFALKLLTGHRLLALSRGDFNKTRILYAASLGTVFPLVFDDVDLSKSEDLIKSYWEVWWKEDCVSPHIVLSSNTPRLRDWAKSRVKRVDFDVHFAPSAPNEEKLQQLFSVDNRMFRWFSYLYLQHLEAGQPASDDELQLARTVLRELYGHAHRQPPDFFPTEPIEKTYDPGRRDWRDLLYGGLKGKARVTREKVRILVEFSKDMQFWEINDYESYLPPTVKHKRTGNTVVIESPTLFDTWLEGQAQRQSPWYTRLLGRRG